MLAASYFLGLGYQVYAPVAQQSGVDFVVWSQETKYQAVQVKTARWMSNAYAHRYLQCRLVCSGRSVIDECDVLAVVNGARIWVIPTGVIDTSNLCLDGTRKGYQRRWDDYERSLDH